MCHVVSVILTDFPVKVNKQICEIEVHEMNTKSQLFSSNLSCQHLNSAKPLRFDDFFELKMSTFFRETEVDNS